MEKIPGGAFWFNFSWQKYSTADGCFWDYLASHSKILERLFWRKIRGSVLFNFGYNKAFHDYNFPVIFSNNSEQLFSKTHPDSCFLNFFRSTEAVTRKKKTALRNLRKFLRIWSCSSKTSTGRASGNQVLQNMLQNFLEHLTRGFSRK